MAKLRRQNKFSISISLFFLMMLIVLSDYQASAADTSAISKPYWETRVPYAGKIVPGELRQIYLLNEIWQYLQANMDFEKVCADENLNWAHVNLPHTWNAFDATDNQPGYRRDVSWYRKEIFIPENSLDKIFRLYFEGVNISCEVYVNDKIAGLHVGGYIGFEIDITQFVKMNANNTILVRADNSINRDIIPSQKADFFIFGGIIRDVWLQVLPKIFIDKIKISTPHVSAEQAETEINLHIVNMSHEKLNGQLDLFIEQSDRKIVAQQSLMSEFRPGKNWVSVEMPAVKKPLLWSTETPNLYTVLAELKNEKIADSKSERFGYRWFEFKINGPFFLNGKQLLLRGTHRHEEYAGYGNALLDSLHRKDMRMIKEMGANFVRLAHYPQDPEVYRACDELGLLVWDELPWCRGGLGDAVWKENTQRLLKEQINQNMNHPSVIFWSLGNELYWLPDFPDGGNIDSLKAFVKQLNDLAHEMDPGRLTAIRKFYDGANITDVFSPSIWAGWYSGVYKEYEQALIKARKKYKRFIHIEYGGASHVGRHTENPITGEGYIKTDEWSEQPNMLNIAKISSDGDWSENYMVDLFDWHLMVTEQLDWFAGNAQWAFKDFGTPLRPENPIPYINQKGLVDRAGKPKDAYYVFKSYWTEKPKFCYIESPTWIERVGKPGEKLEVCVFSNCDRVELFLNGEKQGLKNRDIKNFPAAGFHWNVLFADGKNTLQAKGYSGGKKACQNELEILYSSKKYGKPEDIVLSAQKLPDGNFLILARAIDSKGQTCLDFKARVYFDHNGSGYLLENYGTPTRSSVIEFASGRAAIEFCPGEGGKAVIEARTQDIKGSYLFFDPK